MLNGDEHRSGFRRRLAGDLIIGRDKGKPTGYGGSGGRIVLLFHPDNRKTQNPYRN